MRGGDPGDLAPFLADPAALDRFAAYRNAFVKGAIDALAAAYPALRAAMGRRAFGAAGAAYVAARPPRARSLTGYGEGFAEFVAAGAEAEFAPLIRLFGQLDRAWIESHFAADSGALTEADLAGVEADALIALRPGLSADVRVADMTHDALGAWSALRRTADEDAPAPIPPMAETACAALIHRPDGAVRWRTLSPSEAAFLSVVGDGGALADAGAAAAALQNDFDLARAFACALQDRVFSRQERSS